MRGQLFPALTPLAALPPPWESLARLVVAGKAAAPGLESVLTAEHLETLRDQRMLGLVAHLLGWTRGRGPAEAAKAARLENLSTAQRHLRLMLAARDFVELPVATSGWRALFIKGLPLAHACYERPYLRQTGDLDAVVETRHAHACLAALKQAGWRNVYAVESEDWEGERAEGMKHYEMRAHPRLPDARVEVHTGRYTAFAEWDWEKLWTSAPHWLTPWPEAGAAAWRLRPEPALALAVLHALSDGVQFPLETLSDAARLARELNPALLQEVAALTGTRALVAAQLALLNQAGGGRGWEEPARELWRKAGTRERRWGEFYLRCYWSTAPGRPPMPRYAEGWLAKLRHAFYVPARTVERITGVGRGEKGFRGKRFGVLARRWRKYFLGG